ncbi:hypothetical protein ABT288_14710 [Streptomyces sp. NPDC001093]|uniref:hypothetical protein n=1 Tax=Streptomyces sp. NPDC001093 TaxID=3154376 RepID=UPI00332EA7CD
MPGRTSEPYGNTTARRAVAAAVIAATALILAANAGPARAAEPRPTAQAQHMEARTKAARTPLGAGQVRTASHGMAESNGSTAHR